MIAGIRELRGHKVQAIDGEVGRIADFFFDTAAWTIRYVVLDTGGWLSGRQVLISPVALGRPDLRARAFPLSLTREQIENSPPVEADQPVSRQYEQELTAYYGWPSYWTTEPMFGPAPLLVPPAGAERPREPAAHHGDPHLESVKEVTGYHILAADGEIGHVDDFLVDIDNWVVRYLVVDTRNWLPGKKVLIAPQWVREVNWTDARVAVKLERERIRNSPNYSHDAPLTREYETALYDYYGVPPYWG